MKKLTLTFIATLLIGISFAGCGSASPTTQTPTAVASPAVTPTPTPTPMVRVTIQLNDVVCNGKQSVFWWQKDKFYMLTTFSASGPTPTSPVVTQSQLSDPVTIGNKQTLAIPPGPLVVFDALLPLDGYIRGGFTAYNGGVSNDQIAQFAIYAGQVTENVTSNLQQDSVDSENLYLESGTKILNVAVHALNGILNLNTNNITQLGEVPFERTANGQQTDTGTLSFVQTNGPGGTWNYLIHYTITRTFMNGTN